MNRSVGISAIFAIVGLWMIWPYRPASAFGWLVLGAAVPLAFLVEEVFGTLLSKERGQTMSRRQFSVRRVLYALAVLIPLLVMLGLMAAAVPFDWHAHFVRWSTPKLHAENGLTLLFQQFKLHQRGTNVKLQLVSLDPIANLVLFWTGASRRGHSKTRCTLNDPAPGSVRWRSRRHHAFPETARSRPARCDRSARSSRVPASERIQVPGRESEC